MPNRHDELAQLDKETLVEHVLLLEKHLATLEQQMADLKHVLGVKRRKASKNSLVPPSQDQKATRKPKTLCKSHRRLRNGTTTGALNP